MLKYISSVFSNDDCASFSRWATLFTVITGCWCLVHVVRHGHQLPDATALVGLGAWMTAPYAISKTAGLFGQKPPGAPSP